MRNGNHSRWKAYAAGLAGGVAGTAAMGLYMKGVQSLKKRRQSNASGETSRVHDISLAGRQHEEGESATAAVGRIVYHKVTGREPAPQTKNKLSNMVHWTYGIDMGGTYGLIRGAKPKLDLLGGLAYGAALWAAGDEMAVPLLGLAEGPKAHPKSLHAETLGAHLVYGVATAVTTQLLTRAL